MTTKTDAPALQRAPVHSHPETILGTCQAIADDLGISPYWLRGLFGIGLVLNIGIAIGVYLLLSVLVAALRVALPDQRARDLPVEIAAQPGNDQVPIDTRRAA